MSDEHCGCYSCYDFEIGVKISRDACKFAATLARVKALEDALVHAELVLREILKYATYHAHAAHITTNNECDACALAADFQEAVEEYFRDSVPHESPNSHIDPEYTEGDKEHAEE